jgi:hypothetical protein
MSKIINNIVFYLGLPLWLSIVFLSWITYKVVYGHRYGNPPSFAECWVYFKEVALGVE